MKSMATATHSLMSKACSSIYWLLLTLWIAALISAGVAAGGVFFTLQRIGLTVDAYRSAFGDDTAEHGRLVGGMVMEPIFFATDLVQIVAGLFTLLMLALQLTVFNMRWSQPANLLRTVCIAVAAALVVLHATGFAPRMNRELRGYWNAAQVNDQTAMTAHRQRFDNDHELANRLFTLRFGLLVLAVAGTAAAFTPHAAPRSSLNHSN